MGKERSELQASQRHIAASERPLTSHPDAFLNDICVKRVGDGAPTMTPGG